MSIQSAALLSKPEDSNISNTSPAELEAIEKDKEYEARLENFCTNLIQKSPYIISAPLAKPPHLHAYQADDWKRGSPFAAHEEQLQYLSFVARDLHSDGVLQATGGWDDDHGEMIEATKRHTTAAKCGLTTPQQGQGPVKKISFSDYKNKTGGQLATKDVSKPNGAQHLPTTANDSAPEASKPANPAPPIPDNNPKRSHDNIQDAGEIDPFGRGALPPLKKLRVSPPPPLSISTDTTVKSSTGGLALPRLLSPTLPESIEEELSRVLVTPASKGGTIGHRKNASTSMVSNNQDSSRQTSSPGNAHVKAVKETVTAIHKSQTKGKAPGSGHAIKAELPSHTSDPKLHQTVKRDREEPSAAVRGVAKPSLNGTVNSARKEPMIVAKDKPPKVSKMVKLKIPRRLQKDVVRILRIQPRAKKVEASSVTPKGERKDEKVQSEGWPSDLRSEKEKQKIPIKQHEETTSRQGQSANKPSKPHEKRKRVEEETNGHASHTKRQKLPGSLDLSQKPSTPIPPPFKSPALSQHSSTQKPQGTTPNRDIKSVASRNMEVTGTDVKTPQGQARNGTPLAPNSVEKANRERRSASDTSSIARPVFGGNMEEVSAWRAEQKRLSELGRTLKHDADDIFKKSKDKTTQDDPQVEKRGIATAIETVLCFILAFTVADEASTMSSKVCDVTAWQNLIQYINFVKSVTMSHTLLHGLTLQLEAVVRNRIWTLDLERSERQTLPPSLLDQPRVIATDDIAGHEAAAKDREIGKDYLDFQKKMARNVHIAKKLWIEGAFELSVDDLQQSFPVSWKRKARAPLVHSKEKLTVGSLGGDFYLPLSSISSGIEATRAGWSILGEWCQKEDISWKGKLGL